MNHTSDSKENKFNYKYFEKVKNIIGSNNEERNPYCVFETIIELSPFQKRH